MKYDQSTFHEVAKKLAKMAHLLIANKCAKDVSRALKEVNFFHRKATLIDMQNESEEVILGKRYIIWLEREENKAYQEIMKSFVKKFQAICGNNKDTIENFYAIFLGESMGAWDDDDKFEGGLLQGQLECLRDYMKDKANKNMLQLIMHESEGVQEVATAWNHYQKIKPYSTPEVDGVASDILIQLSNGLMAITGKMRNDFPSKHFPKDVIEFRKRFITNVSKIESINNAILNLEVIRIELKNKQASFETLSIAARLSLLDFLQKRLETNLVRENESEDMLQLRDESLVKVAEARLKMEVHQLIYGDGVQDKQERKMGSSVR